jgi:hypothetical protein
VLAERSEANANAAAHGAGWRLHHGQ